MQTNPNCFLFWHKSSEKNGRYTCRDSFQYFGSSIQQKRKEKQNIESVGHIKRLEQTHAYLKRTQF